MNNEYIQRKVASKDAQCCIICSLPTTCVLFQNQGMDWFYCCELHLKDNPQFAKPIHTQEYLDALEEVKRLKSAIDSKQANSSGNWDGWVKGIFIKKPNNGDKDKDDGQDEEASEEALGESLESQYQRSLESVVQHQKAQRKFSMSDVMFGSRLQLKKQIAAAKLRKQKEQEAYTSTDPAELEARFDFPTVPR
ncbi:LAMI_0D07228g1_1 [Lachancea mirantina]|uniref:LAMI_0D07228g1_1 n=1 Tax=Lachancea mirantina TaxID=1230905 RepID=A0A1G4JCW1_9SACH|nr:LAMI_0D07228g1_1 [Lachancea mirantina]